MPRRVGLSPDRLYFPLAMAAQDGPGRRGRRWQTAHWTGALLAALLLFGSAPGGAAAETDGDPAGGTDPGGQATAASPGPVESTWQTYHSAAGGYTIAVPGDWLVQETAAADGASVATLASDTGGIVVRAGAGAGGEAGDLPNTLCRSVTVGGLPGSQCTDTLSRSVAITLEGPTGRYRLAAARTLDPALLAQILATFQADGASDGGLLLGNQTVAASVGDRCGLRVGVARVRALCPSP